ncbi:MAG: NirD/YgiW/YdeI family stress tolerance protein [Albidovulum sp.]
MKKILAVSLLCGLLSTFSYSLISASSTVATAPSATSEQFAGPEAAGQVSTVQEVKTARLGSYVTVVGNIVDHLREDYYTFRDETGEIRVEIEDRVWQNRSVTPDTQVRLLAEVDRNLVGIRYLWVKSLEIVE